MLKKAALRRIMISTLALIIVSILYFFPNNNFNEITQSIEYVQVDKSPIYLLNNDMYIIRTSIASKSTDQLSLIKEMIEALTIGSNKKEYIPKNFSQIIPKNTTVLNLSLNEGLLKIDFSKDILKIDKNLEEKMIEAIVYTLTEIEGVEEIMLFVEGNKLETLPETNIKLPNTLNRTYGINKIYDITNLKDLTKTTIYYIGKNDNLTYYVPITKIENNSNNNKIEIIIDELKSSPIYETNLMSYLASGVELENYEELENQITLSFNNAIFDDLLNNKILEEVKYSISLSLKDSLNVEEIIFKVDGKVVETFKAYT